MPVENVLPLLRGMFAFAWWDEHERQLVVARDQFGIKPLYFAEGESGELFVGSELRSVAQLTGTTPEVNRTALMQYVRWGAVQAPETIFKQVRSLMPGHLLRWCVSGVREVSYFTPSWSGPSSGIVDQAEIRQAVRRTVLNSVKAHLVSDVPVGVFLSGGLDSTLMAACMKELGQTSIKAFSIGYEEGAGVPDETDAAERTAQALGCEFYRYRVTANSMGSELDAYFDSLDQPTGDALNTFLVSKVAAQHVKVALSGLGADEWFAGYNFHRLVMLASRSPLAKSALGQVSAQLVRGSESFLPSSLQGKLGYKLLLHATGGAGAAVDECHAYGRSVLHAGRAGRLLGVSPHVMDERTLLTPERTAMLKSLPSRTPASWIAQLLMLETQTYLPNTLLRDNDCTSMAHSLELRVPLVDREVFRLAGEVPDASKLNWRSGKVILREAFADLLPEWIANDRKKKTFTLPLMKWLRSPAWQERIRDTVMCSDARINQWMDGQEVKRCVERYYASSTNTKQVWHLSQPVWMLLVLESWLRQNVR